jgi:hypothetical protein
MRAFAYRDARRQARRWRPPVEGPTADAVYELVRNLAYAGAFVFGRHSLCRGIWRARHAAGPPTTGA